MSGIQMALLGTGGAPSSTAAFTDASVADSQPIGAGSASASYRITNGGIVQTGLSGTYSFYETWCNPTSAAADFEVFATLTSGTLSSGTTGSWLGLGTTRTWTRNRTTVGVSSAVLTMDVRRVGTTTVLDTWTVTLDAELYV